MKRLKLRLYGLARAADNNEHMLNAETFALVREALAVTAYDEHLALRLAEEKRRIVPMCADCTHPCGRTADPDESVLQDAYLLSIENELLMRLIRCGIAFYGEKETERLCSQLH